MEFTEPERLMRDKIREEIRELVGEKRYPHVLSTEKECLALADIFSLDNGRREALAISALLHDITKRYTADEHIRFMRERGHELSEINIACEKTLHAVTGAFLAKELYPELVDDCVFSSILFHTTGKADMSLYQKLLYLADYIEPRRSFPDCVKLREYFYSNIGREDKYKVLDDTLLLSFDMTIADIIKNGGLIHPDTVSARNFLVQNNSN